MAERPVGQRPTKAQATLQHRLRWSTQWLVLSLAGNAALTIALIWSSWPSRTDPIPLDFKPAASLHRTPGLADHLCAMSQLGWEGLCGSLEDQTPVEFGFCMRDLALARLVHDYGLDLPRALGKMPSQKRPCRLGQEQITLFAGLRDGDFQRLQALIASERFPLTPEGCIRLLQRAEDWNPQDRADLKSTLCASVPWKGLEDLFRHGPPRSREQLIQLALETGWSPIESFWQQQRKNRDVSDERRRRFLVELFDRQSRLAGRWLLDEDLAWLQQKLSDPQVLKMIAMVLPASAESKAFLRGILMSPRSDAVRRCAGEKLYALAGEPAPEGMTVLTALQRHCPEVAAALQPTLKLERAVAQVPAPAKPPAALPPPTATKKGAPARAAKLAQLAIEVQAGDSLWKISRRHGVSVEQIRQLNRLEGDRLRVGQTLMIPTPASP